MTPVTATDDPARPEDATPAAGGGADGVVTLAVDAMGGDRGPETILDGLARAAFEDPKLRFLAHGEAETLAGLLKTRPDLAAICEISPSDSVVPMDARPSQALRSGRRSSMWLTLDAVAEGRAQAALSAGNTGALMTMATVRLRPIEGVARPAIAALWPSRNRAGFNVVLDVGADLRADADNLVDYALMGVEYARIVLETPRPRAALLNVGVEEAKGPPALGEAAERLAALAGKADFEFVGYTEGDRISSADADVIVTDGFTGNVALKTAEGTARQIGGFLREAFFSSIAGRAAGLIAAPSLKALKRRMDPSRVNGGVFLGLAGLVVKSHGGADAAGVAAAANLAARMGRGDIAARIASQVAKSSATGDDGAVGSQAGDRAGGRAGKRASAD